jgi:retron-type reverse transcriptase
MDEEEINCIVFLDLRKGFDSINHNILLSRMRSNFGISGNELLWLASYLTNREQQCVANGILSSVGKLKCGVPQGSILGPLLFLLYINNHHNVSIKPRRVCMLMTRKFTRHHTM